MATQLKRLLGSWWRNNRSRGLSQTLRVRPFVEELEGRRVPTATIGASALIIGRAAAPGAIDPVAKDLQADVAFAKYLEARLDKVQAGMAKDEKDIDVDTKDLNADNDASADLTKHIAALKTDIAADLKAGNIKEATADDAELKRLEAAQDRVQADIKRDENDLDHDQADLKADHGEVEAIKQVLADLKADITADKNGDKDQAQDNALAKDVQTLLDHANDDISRDKKDIDKDTAELKTDHDKADDLGKKIEALKDDITADVKAGNIAEATADAEELKRLEARLDRVQNDITKDESDLDHDQKDLKADHEAASDIEAYLDGIQADIQEDS
jgi:hypothetical protein